MALPFPCNAQSLRVVGVHTAAAGAAAGPPHLCPLTPAIGTDSTPAHACAMLPTLPSAPLCALPLHSPPPVPTFTPHRRGIQAAQPHPRAWQCNVRACHADGWGARGGGGGGRAGELARRQVGHPRCIPLTHSAGCPTMQPGRLALPAWCCPFWAGGEWARAGPGVRQQASLQQARRLSTLPPCSSQVPFNL